jgi:hypothetical protein
MLATLAKRLSFGLIAMATGLALLLFPGHSRAQNTFEAQTFARPGVGCYRVGAGLAWSFVPISNLLVTAVYSSAPQISFWKETNQIECKTNLHEAYWQLLTNLLVTQSPYAFVDLSTPPAPTRFYRVSALDDTTPAMRP